VEDFIKEEGQVDHHEVPAPRGADVRHCQRDARHRGENLAPWNWRLLLRRLRDVLRREVGFLLRADPRMRGGIVVGEHGEDDAPQKATETWQLQVALL
jgi:hypothetical protein